MPLNFMMPPEGTSSGYRTSDGAMWQAGFTWYHTSRGKRSKRPKPAILYCQHPGNLLNPELNSLVATFEKVADRDLVLALHKQLVVRDESAAKPFRVWIRWGADEYGNEPQLYEFATLPELNAFLQGVEAGDGWANWEQFDTEEEVQAWYKEHQANRDEATKEPTP